MPLPGGLPRHCTECDTSHPMAWLFRWTAIALALVALGSGIFVVAVSHWTQGQLRQPGIFPVVCLSPKWRARLEAGIDDPRPTLARAALYRGYPERKWGPTLNWHAHYAAVGYLGFLFIPHDEQVAMLARVRTCPKGVA